MIKSSMPRVKILPFGEPNCYLVLSGSTRPTMHVGRKWHGEADRIQQYPEDGLSSAAHITFAYMRNGIAAEWDGEHGPIQLRFECDKKHRDSSPHWFWPFAYGSEYWSQQAVDENQLPNAFITGDWDHIFNTLKNFVTDRLEGQNNDY